MENAIDSGDLPSSQFPAVGLFVLLSALLCIGLPIRWLLSHEWPRLRQALFFPLSGQVRWEHATQRKRLLRRIGAVEVALETADDRIVHCIWAEAPARQQAPAAGDGADGGDGSITTGPAGPVAILLHANAMVLDDMVDWMQFYLSLGISVFAVTFWGYPDPSETHGCDEHGQLLAETDEGGFCPTELSIYLDAEAALDYVRQVQRASLERIVVHGLSMGGAAAASLGVRHPGLKVTLDQTFTSMWQVSSHVGRGLYEQIVMQKAPRSCRSFLRCIAPCLVPLGALLLVAMAFKTRAPRFRDRCAPLDRLNTVRKLGRMTGDVFILCAEHDEMMPPHFAERLFSARYGRRSSADLRHSRLVTIPGGHCSFFGEVPELCSRYRTYLALHGMA